MNARKVLKKINVAMKIKESVKVDSTESTFSFEFSSPDELVKSEKLLKSLSYSDPMVFSHDGNRRLVVSTFNTLRPLKTYILRKMIKALNDDFGYEIALPSGF